MHTLSSDIDMDTLSPVHGKPVLHNRFGTSTVPMLTSSAISISRSQTCENTFTLPL